MNAEFIAMLDYLERERGIKREILLEAVSNALLSASKKSVSASRDLRIDINPKTGEIRALAKLLVVEDVTNPADEISVNKARRIDPNAAVGGEVEIEVTPKNFGRIAAQTAKQAMMQRIRQVEKEMIYEEFKDRAGEIVSGTVRRFDRSDVILDLGKFEAIMPQRERVVVPLEDERFSHVAEPRLTCEPRMDLHHVPADFGCTRLGHGRTQGTRHQLAAQAVAQYRPIG